MAGPAEDTRILYVMARAGALTMLGALAACGASGAALHGAVFEPPRPAPAVVLVDQDGSHFALTQLRGSVVALFFGFTHCADVCPQTLRHLDRAVREAHAAKPIRIVMITVDRRRDDPAALRRFIEPASARATGLTGTARALQTIYREYGVVVQQERTDIGHTDSIFVIGSDGTLREVLDPATSLTNISSDLRTIAG